MKRIVRKNRTTISVEETIPERVHSVEYKLVELIGKKKRLQKALDQTNTSLATLNLQMAGLDGLIGKAIELGVKEKEEEE